MKFLYIIFLTLLAGGCSTQAQLAHQNINNALNNTWTGYKGCMSSLNGDPNIAFMQEKILIEDNAPNKYEVLQSSKMATNKDREVIAKYNAMTKFCRDTLISELFNINPALGNLIMKMRSDSEIIVDAFAIGKISLGELNHKNSILMKNMEKDYFDILANISNNLSVAHQQESNSRLQYFRESLRQGIRQEQMMELERQRALRQPPQ
jgi:hypothetical protein